MARTTLAVVAGAALAGAALQAAEEAAWPPVVKAPAGAPNVVIILLDDNGYGEASVFGGPVPTPNIDQLASQGLRYNNFHVNAMCSPTRAALLSGRNSHEIGFGRITESANRAPGYTSLWPKTAASLAEVLKRNGYSTAAFGKWHNTPTWEVNPSGPFEHWPTSLGFEYFYGFLGAATSQYDPALYRDTTPVTLPKTPEQGYLLNPDLVDQARQWLHQHEASAPGRPFFLYFATGAIHVPHQVPRDWIAKFKGQFDKGWDKQREETFARQKALGIIPANAEFTARPAELPAWDSYSADQQKIFAAQEEVYAAYLAETDYELGRLLDDLKRAGHTNDTAFFVIVGDNGASAEGGLDPRVGNAPTVAEQLAHIGELGSRDLTTHIQSGWAWAANTPFKWAKRTASHLGGTTDPLIVSWPGHIPADGSVRHQFSFLTDIAPTIYELAKVEFPQEVDGVKQLPLEGSSLVYSFADPQAPSRHTSQYFEMVGNRGVYKDGWWAGSRKGLPWGAGNGSQVESSPWELYNLTEDFTQAHDLAAQNPDKLKELEDFFAAEAERNHVYPVDERGLAAGGGGRSGADAEGSARRTRWTYYAGAERIPPQYTPKLGGESHTITAKIEVGDETPNGVIFAQGGRAGGYALFVKDGRVIYEGTPGSATPATVPHTQIIGGEPLPKGKSVIEVIATRIEPATEAGGAGQQGFQIVLRLNGNTIANGEFRGVPFGGGNAFGGGRRAGNGSLTNSHLGGTNLSGVFRGGGGGGGSGALSIGSNQGTPVSRDYAIPNSFNGVIDEVTFAVAPPNEDTP
jgi:arylsulfatase